MSRPPILKPGESYTFRNYFELAFNPEDILAEFDCSLSRASLDFSKYQNISVNNVVELKQKLTNNLTIVDLTSETARREILIAPILLELCQHTNSKLKIEYPIYINELLKGDLDYLVQSESSILVVEAKNADLSKGFTQLAIELIALDSWISINSESIYGAVTTGDIWKFGFFHRQSRQIVQDINLYRVPADLEALLQILIGIISGLASSA